MVYIDGLKLTLKWGEKYNKYIVQNKEKRYIIIWNEPMAQNGL